MGRNDFSYLKKPYYQKKSLENNQQYAKKDCL